MLNKFNRVMGIILEDVDKDTLDNWKTKATKAKENLSEKALHVGVSLEQFAKKSYTKFEDFKDKK